MRMLERRQNVALAAEAAAALAGQEVRMGQLERHLATVGAVAAGGEPHRAHAAAAQLALELIGPDGLARPCPFFVAVRRVERVRAA